MKSRLKNSHIYRFNIKHYIYKLLILLNKKNYKIV